MDQQNKKNDFDWKNALKKCFESTDYCSLATIDAELGVWVNPVYFAFDEHYNLYFISLIGTRHMQNLSEDDRVAVAIYSTSQKGEVIGSQISARARILDDKGEIDEAFKVYYGRTGSLQQNGSFQHNPDWIFVKVSPDKISYFDSAVFGEERQEVPEEIYK